jgi:hypothetical protein
MAARPAAEHRGTTLDAAQCATATLRAATSKTPARECQPCFSVAFAAVKVAMTTTVPHTVLAIPPPRV